MKMMYMSFDGGKLTSTIANLDIEEMCYCLACVILKHIDRGAEKQLEEEWNKSRVLQSIQEDEKEQKKKKKNSNDLNKNASKLITKSNVQKVSKHVTTKNTDDTTHHHDVHHLVHFSQSKQHQQQQQQQYHSNSTNDSILNRTGNPVEEPTLIHEDYNSTIINSGLAEKYMQSMYLQQQQSQQSQMQLRDNSRQKKRLSEISEKVIIDSANHRIESALVDENTDSIPQNALDQQQSYDVDNDDGSNDMDQDNEFLPMKYDHLDDQDDAVSRGEVDMTVIHQGSVGNNEPEQHAKENEQGDENDDDDKNNKNNNITNQLSFSRISRYSMVLANDDVNNKRLFEKTFDYCENSDAIYAARPTRENIQNYCKNACISCQLEKQIPIIALVYVERLLQKSGFAVTPLNWRKIILTAMIMASKIWDDESFENQNFAQAFTQFDVVQINEMERVFLSFIEYNLYVRGADYAKYYFILREFAQKNKKSFPLRPLDLKTILFLQNNANKALSNLREICSNPLNKSF